MHLRQELESRFPTNNNPPPPPRPRVGHGPQNLFGGIMGGPSSSSDRLPAAENNNYVNGEGSAPAGHPPPKRLRTEEPYDREMEHTDKEREREQAVPTPPPPPNVATIGRPSKGKSIGQNTIVS
jgi:hypothetical protein